MNEWMNEWMNELRSYLDDFLQKNITSSHQMSAVKMDWLKNDNPLGKRRCCDVDSTSQ